MAGKEQKDQADKAQRPAKQTRSSKKSQGKPWSKREMESAEPCPLPEVDESEDADKAKQDKR
jgi:hypothetical protein